MGHVNLNCLTNKVAYVELLMKENKIDILGISETWLISEVTDSFVSIENYVILRSNDPSSSRKHGVATYIKNDIRFEKIECELKNIIIIKLLDSDIYVITVYRPPSYNASENRLLILFLQEFCTDREVVLQGDFNLPTLRWENEEPAGRYVSPLDLTFMELFADLGLTQVVCEPTNFPSGNTIDLCFLSHHERLGSISVLPPLPACSHGLVLVQYTFQRHVSSNSNPNKCIWAKGKYSQINSRLDDIVWEVEFAGLNVQQMNLKLTAIVKNLVDRYVPTSSRDCSKPPWTLNPPRSALRSRSNLFVEFKEKRTRMGRNDPSTLEAWQHFTAANNNVKNFAIDSQKAYEANIARRLSTEPKLFHSYLRHRRVGRPTIGPLKTADGDVTDNPLEMAEQFVKSFKSVFATGTLNNPAPHQVSMSVLPEVEISILEVQQELVSLDVNSCMGADEIHPRLLSHCAATLCRPLSLIYSASLREGLLPLEWLSSQIVPIFKKGARTDPLNYRPVAMTSVPCKVLERIIVRRMKSYLEDNNLISMHQFGFRSLHSTTDQLILAYEEVTRDVDEAKMVDMLFFDFSKAFDKVSHVVLIQKLNEIGICPQLCNWIQHFLSARRMQVRVHQATSSWHRVYSGVPQGSVLGPQLFLIYVNHVVSGLSCRYKIFADDIKLYLSSMPQTNERGITDLQSDIDLLVNTAASWGLNMNVSKCACLRFGPRTLGPCSEGQSPYLIGQEHIKYSANHTDLGVKVDNMLKFHHHIRNTANVCNALTTNILSSTLCRSPDFILATYTSLIRPKLEYGSTVWHSGYLGDLRILERVQRRWTRSIIGLGDLPYEERLKRLDLFSVQGRLLRADLILVWKIFAGECAINCAQFFTLNISSRRGHSRKLYLPKTQRDTRKRFFSVRVVKAWNSLTEQTVTATSLTQFKSFLHRDLGQQLFEYAN